MNYLWMSSNIPVWLTTCKSVSIKSNTIYRSLLFYAFIISYYFIQLFLLILLYFHDHLAHKEIILLYMFFMRQLHCEMHQKPWILINITFFNAIILPDFLSIAFHTTPYAPFPSFLIISNLLKIWSCRQLCKRSIKKKT